MIKAATIRLVVWVKMIEVSKKSLVDEKLLVNKFARQKKLSMIFRKDDFTISGLNMLSSWQYVITLWEQQSVSDVEVRDKSNTLCPVIPEQTEAIILNQTPEPRE